jgi:hypothetical protein
MEAMIAFGLVLGFLVGGMMLALVMGYLSTEEARAGEKERHPGQVVLGGGEAIASFFAKSDRSELPSETTELDEMLLARLESHVREEQALVSEFVHYPSIDSLYRRGPQALRMH